MSERTTMNGKPVFTVPSKTIINFKSGFGHKLLCDDMTFTTGTACTYKCSFCYVPSAMKKQDAWLDLQGVKGKHEDIVIRRANPIEIARKQLQGAKNKDKPLVIYASPLVDVAGNMELVRETVEMCKLILGSTEWHIRLLSKSNLLPQIASALSKWAMMECAPYEKVVVSPKTRIIYGVSTGTLDDQVAAAFEEGCPLVKKRIESLHWLQDNGFRTFGMICPSLPQVIKSQSYYDDWAAEIHHAIRSDRCEHVWAEVINLRGDSFTNTIKRLTDSGDPRCLQIARRLEEVCGDKVYWEDYARMTFLAHKNCFDTSKLRFLQYVTKDTDAWWTQPGVVKL